MQYGLEEWREATPPCRLTAADRALGGQGPGGPCAATGPHPLGPWGPECPWTRTPPYKGARPACAGLGRRLVPPVATAPPRLTSTGGVLTG